MKDSTILPNHYVSIISILYIKQVLDKTKTRISLCEFSKNVFRGVLFTEFLEIWKKTTVLVLAFDFAYGFTVFYEFVKCPMFFRQDFISDYVFFSKYGVYILTELNG